MNDRDFNPRRPGPSVSRGVFGFVLYLVSQLTFGVYIAWIIVPQRIIIKYGIDDFLPDKYWILALPAWLSIAVLFIWLIYFAINEQLADRLDYYKLAFQ